MAANGANGKNGKADNKVVTAYRAVEAAFGALDRGEGTVEDTEKYFKEFKSMVDSVKLTPRSEENAKRVITDLDNKLKAYQEAEKIKVSVTEVGDSLRKYLGSTEADKRYAWELLGAYQEAVDAYKVADLPEGAKKRRENVVKEFNNNITALEDRIAKLSDAKPQIKAEVPVEMPKPVETPKPIEVTPISIYDKYPNDPDWRDLRDIEEWLEKNPVKNKSA